MIVLGTDEMAKYPFLTDAGQYLRDKGFTLEQFGRDPDLGTILEKAVRRIEAAVYRDGSYRSALVENRVSGDAALPLEVFSFLLAAVLLKLSGAATLVKRFSLSEAQRAEKHLEQDLDNIADSAKEQLATKIIFELFSVTVTRQGDSFTIPVKDYLKHSVKLHEREWKLINRRVERGQVFLDRHETVRVIRNELVNYISSRIQSAQVPPMAEGFEGPITRLTEMAKMFAVPVVETTEYPPCIKHAISVLEKGENLPHSGRFMLATYLLGKGQTVDQIAPLFKNAPDYSERVTRYQLNHLSGGSGSSTKYTCPSCDKARVQGLCFAVPECDGIVNPLQFGRRRR